MKDTDNISGYQFHNDKPLHSHSYLMPVIAEELKLHSANFPEKEKSVFDLGCGNGVTAQFLAEKGYGVTGVDPSVEGISRGSWRSGRRQGGLFQSGELAC